MLAVFYPPASDAGPTEDRERHLSPVWQSTRVGHGDLGARGRGRPHPLTISYSTSVLYLIQPLHLLWQRGSPTGGSRGSQGTRASPSTSTRGGRGNETNQSLPTTPGVSVSPTILAPKPFVIPITLRAGDRLSTLPALMDSGAY